MHVSQQSSSLATFKKYSFRSEKLFKFQTIIIDYFNGLCLVTISLNWLLPICYFHCYGTGTCKALLGWVAG